MISRSASDNQYLVQAKRHCLERQSAKPSEERPEAPDRYEQIILKIREVLNQGGDGNFYILAPKLWEPGIRAKSGDATLLVSRMDKQCSLTQASWSVESMWSPC